MEFTGTISRSTLKLRVSTGVYLGLTPNPPGAIQALAQLFKTLIKH